MRFIQRFKVLFVILVINLIVIEMRPDNSDPYPQNEDHQIDGAPSSISDETPMNADSFPLAPDVQDAPRMGVMQDYHIRKLIA